MLSTLETGNNLLVEWYADTIKSEVVADKCLIDRDYDYQFLVGYDSEGLVNLCKVYDLHHEFPTLLVNRKMDRQHAVSLDPFNAESLAHIGNDKTIMEGSSFGFVNNLIDSIKKGGSFKGIIISILPRSAHIIGVSDEKLMFHKILAFDKIQDVFYTVCAVRHSFLDGQGSLYIESTKQVFEECIQFFKNYFENIEHLYKPISDYCMGIDKDSIIDVNCYLLDSIIHKNT